MGMGFQLVVDVGVDIEQVAFKVDTRLNRPKAVDIKAWVMKAPLQPL